MLSSRIRKIPWCVGRAWFQEIVYFSIFKVFRRWDGEKCWMIIKFTALAIGKWESVEFYSWKGYKQFFFSFQNLRSQALFKLFTHSSVLSGSLMIFASVNIQIERGWSAVLFSIPHFPKTKSLSKILNSWW